MTNVSLRLLTIEDHESLYKLVNTNRASFVRYFPITCANTETLELSKKYVEGLVEKSNNKTLYAHGIFLKDALIGVILIRDIDWRIPKCELGYYLDANFQGKGIMTNATKQMIAHCFDDLKMNKIFLRASPDNIGSVSVAEKCGFIREGLLRKEFRIETGELVDSIYFGLLKSDWVV